VSCRTGAGPVAIRPVHRGYPSAHFYRFRVEPLNSRVGASNSSVNILCILTFHLKHNTGEFSYHYDGVRLCLCGTAAANGPFVHPPDDT
jgi:hypothetical protein